MTTPIKYKDYFEVVFTLSNGSIVRRYATQNDLDTVFGDWPDIREDGILQFKFEHPATLMFGIKLNLIDLIETFKIQDHGQPDPQ